MWKIIGSFLFGVSIVVVVIIVSIFSSYKTNPRAEKNCHSLRLGMTKDQVKAVMGEPLDTFYVTQTDLSKSESWYFGPSSAGSGTIGADFDPISELLVNYSCEEGFWVGIDEESINKFGVDSLLRFEEVLSQVQLGQSRDSVYLMLGDPIRKYFDFGELVWQYYGLVEGDGRPTIKFDSASNKVIRVQSGLQFFKSEESAVQFLAPMYSETNYQN